MKTIHITLLTAVIFGLAGYFFGNLGNPSSDLYHALRKAGYSDNDIKHLPRSPDEIINYFNTSDHNTGAMSLHVYRLLATDDDDEARDFLVDRLAYYHSAYSPILHPDQNHTETQLLLVSHIESAAQEYPELQAAIAKKKE